MSEDNSFDVAAWLSELSSLPHTSQTPATPTKSTSKRNRLSDDDDHHLSPPQKHPQIRQRYHHYYPLTHTALTELSLDIMNTPSPSVHQRSKKIKVSGLTSSWPSSVAC